MKFFKPLFTILLGCLLSIGMLTESNAQGSGTIIVNLETNPASSGVDFSFSSPLFLTVNSPGTITGDYAAGGANFGPPLDLTGTTGNLKLAAPILGDPPPLNDLTGKIAVVDRGNGILFIVKVKNAQDAGAIAVIVVNHIPGQGILTMGGTDPTITIPSIFISYEDGQLIKNELLSGSVNATLRSTGINNSFSLQHGDTQTFSNVPSGSYQITEDSPFLSPPYGYMLEAISIVDPDGGSGSDLGTRTATIDLDAGETIEVTFINNHCTLNPPAANRLVNTQHTVSLTLVEDGVTISSFPVDFSVFVGPNAGKSATVLTDANGVATYTYTGDGGSGTDSISADVDGFFMCYAEVNWGSYDIYAVNYKNGTVERVTSIYDADEYNPSFNNNGKLVAHDVVGGSAPLGHSIYITDVSSGVSTLLVGAEGGNDASWSPNGQLIAFDRSNVGDPNIYTVSSGGGTRTLVRENAIDAEWSNNSKSLVFTDNTDFSLRTVHINSGSETSLGVQGINPSWSPDGKYIVYSDLNNLFKIKVNQAGEPQGSPVQITNDDAGIFNQQPSWSNNSKTIVFHSNRVSGDFDIWTVSSSGGTPTLLTGDSENGDFDPCYSKNGKYVAYAGFTITDPSIPKTNSSEVSNNLNSVPSQYILEQNYPNPFNPTTQIRFGIPEAANVKIEVFSITGEVVNTLVDEFKGEGFYEVSFDASGLPSGMYLYRIIAGAFLQTKKMILLR